MVINFSIVCKWMKFSLFILPTFGISLLITRIIHGIDGKNSQCRNNLMANWLAARMTPGLIICHTQQSQMYQNKRKPQDIWIKSIN